MEKDISTKMYKTAARFLHNVTSRQSLREKGLSLYTAAG